VTRYPLLDSSDLKEEDDLLLGRCSVPSAFLVAALYFASPALAQLTGEEEDPASWRRIGSFRGSEESGWSQKFHDLLFEVQNDGDLYQDLGALTLGLGLDTEELFLDWDNSFYRRVIPAHTELAPGSRVTADDISRYADVFTYVMRTRARYDYVPSLIGDAGLGAEVESGVSLTLVRARTPLRLGDRPLVELVSERSEDDYQEMTKVVDPGFERGFFGKIGGGLGAVAGYFTDKLVESQDTEQGFMFFGDYPDSITLLADLGVPVQTKLFRSSDPRLSVGDQVRQVTFVGVSPIAISARELNTFRLSYKLFFRLLSSTTLIKEENSVVRVKVRNALGRGNELIPMKIRPELRFLGFIRLAYTLFEERWDWGTVQFADFEYLVDLEHPRGLEALEALLGQGQRATFRPLRTAAFEHAGVELVDSKTRDGHARNSLRRVRLFSPFSYTNHRSVVSDIVRHGDAVYRETLVANSKRFQKRFGTHKTYRREFLVSALGNEFPDDPSRTAEEPSVSVTMMTVDSNDHVDDRAVDASVEFLRAGIGPHDVLDTLANLNIPDFTRYFLNVRLSFGQHHLTYLENVRDDELWAELADVLLGPDYRHEWASFNARERWQRRAHRRQVAAALGDDVLSLPHPTDKDMDVGDRWRLARSTVRKFHEVQETIRVGECVACLRSAFRRWRHVGMLQIMMMRLSRRAPGDPPGFHYELYVDELLRPVTVTNGIDYEVHLTGEPTPSLEEADQRARFRTGEWLRRDDAVEAAVPRLQAGIAYVDISDDEEDIRAPCWKLRLFADLRFDPDLDVRITLRTSKGLKKDLPIATALFPIGEEAKIEQTPFMTARFYYDVDLPTVALVEGEAYTLLIRVLNPAGYSVTEEQLLRFVWPQGAWESMPPRCENPGLPLLPEPTDTTADLTPITD